MTLIFTDPGAAKPYELEVNTSVLVEHANGAGFLMSDNNQMRGPDGEWYQILFERSSVPICMIEDPNIKDLQSLADQIFHESAERAKQAEYNKAKKNAWAEKLVIIVALVIGGSIIMFAISRFAG